MKKKAIKIAASTAVAASAFVAAAPANQADAATNVNQLATDAQNAGTVLKWAISVEGSADYVTRPYDQYNAAKKAIANAEAAAKKATASEQLSINAKLVEPKLQVKRAQAYIDAITSSEKIQELTAGLDAAIKTDDIEKVETAYHKATAEYRKQAALLDRVYGQSTRDGIRNEVKPAIEKLVASVKNEVTVNMLAKSANTNIKAGKLVEAAQNVADAQAILDANALKWETSLQKSVDDIVASLPLSVVSVSSTGSNTAVVKLSKPVSAVHLSQFSFDNNLGTTAAVLSEDGKTVTLTTTTQAAATKYTLTYNGTTASFTTAGTVDNSLITVDGSAVHKTQGERVTINAVFKEKTNENSQAKVRVLVPQAFDVASIQAKAPVAATTATEVIGTVTYNVYETTPNASGDVSVILAGNTALDKTVSSESGKVTFRKIFNDGKVDEKSTGTINFYKVLASGSLTDAVVDYVDPAKKYFVATDAVNGKALYYVKGGDALYELQSSLLNVDKFFAALNKGDKVSSTLYNETSSSDFRITFNNVLAGFAFDDKFFVKGDEDAAGYYRQDDSRLVLEGTGDNGYVVHIFDQATTTKLGEAKVEGGKWKFATNVDHNAVATFEVVYKPVGDSYTSLTVGDGEVLNVLEGDFTHTTDFTEFALDDSLLGDTLTLTAADVAGLGLVTDSFKVASNATITLVDGDGTEVKYTRNKDNSFEVSTDTTENDTLAITFGSSFTTVKAGSTAGLQGSLSIKAVTGITNDYGLSLKAVTNAPVITKGAY